MGGEGRASGVDSQATGSTLSPPFDILSMALCSVCMARPHRVRRAPPPTEDVMNAAAMPGGKVVIFTGLKVQGWDRKGVDTEKWKAGSLARKWRAARVFIYTCPGVSLCPFSLPPSLPPALSSFCSRPHRPRPPSLLIRCIQFTLPPSLHGTSGYSSWSRNACTQRRNWRRLSDTKSPTCSSVILPNRWAPPP